MDDAIFTIVVLTVSMIVIRIKVPKNPVYDAW